MSGIELTSIIVLLIDAISGMQRNNLWILVESLSKIDYLLQIPSHAMALKFYPSVTY